MAKSKATARHRREATSDQYISNPFGLIKPSVRALQLNLWSLLLVLAVGIIVAVGLISLALLALAYGELGGRPGSLALSAIGAVVLLAFGLAVVTPWLIIILLESAKGAKVRLIHVVGRGWRYSGRIVGSGILAALATLGGLFLLIIPGIIFATWFSLTAYVIVDQDAGAIESMRRSKALVSGHLREMWGLYGLSSFLAILPFVGDLISIILTILTLPAPAIRYLQLQELQVEQEDEDASLPAVHWANYLVIILVIIGAIWGATSQSNTSANQTGYARSAATISLI